MKERREFKTRKGGFHIKGPAKDEQKPAKQQVKKEGKKDVS